MKNKLLVAALFAFMLAPAVGFAQQPQSEQEEIETDQQEIQSGSTNSGPWQNSPGNTIGTRDQGGNPKGNGQPVDPRLGPGGGTIGKGPTADGRTPGGNPDVPFDPAMNLAFLVAGVAFSYYVYRRKFQVKPATVKS